MLEVNGISVYYGDLQVLWDISFTVQAGETFVLIGANGAGKSTLIKTISALLTPAKGEIRCKGVSMHDLPPYRIIEHGIVHVPEGRRLFNEMNVEENLIMGSLHGEAKTKRWDTLTQIYERFPRLKERRHQSAGTLSGGEQQMLAIGRGLMSLPKLMMLDEPSLGLSPLLVSEVFQMIAEIRQQGVTILLVEQNVTQTLKMCDRACVLENGRITLQGTPAEISADSHIKEAYLGI